MARTSREEEPQRQSIKKQKMHRKGVGAEKPIPVKEKHHNKAKKNDEETNIQREKRELERRREAERMEKLEAREIGKYFNGANEGEFPLRQAVILSEVIGKPRCKSRHRRER